jgi:plastocyanin
MKPYIYIIIAVIVIILIGAGIYFVKLPSQPNINNQQGNSNQPGISDITISNSSFSPQTITVSAGSTVVWTNKDSSEHSIVSDNNQFPSSPRISNGQAFSTLLTEKGTYSYHCGVNTSIKGKIIVK